MDLHLILIFFSPMETVFSSKQYGCESWQFMYTIMGKSPEERLKGQMFSKRVCLKTEFRY